MFFPIFIGAGDTAPPATDVVITPSVGVSGITEFTATPDGPASTYQWYNNATPIAGATSQTYTSDGLFGTTLLHCQVNGSVMSSSPAVMLYAKQVGLSNSASGALTVTGFTVMNGQTFYVAFLGTPDDATVGITGQTLTQFQDTTLGTTTQRHVYWGRMTGFTGSSFEVTWTPTTNDPIGMSVWQAVGFDTDDDENDADQQPLQNQTPVTLTTTAGNGLTLIKAVRYDGITGAGVVIDSVGSAHSAAHIINLTDTGALSVTCERGGPARFDKFASLVRIPIA